MKHNVPQIHIRARMNSQQHTYATVVGRLSKFCIRVLWTVTGEDVVAVSSFGAI